ncbi:MAG: hypothetical protein M1831_000827 [Alyxoria varia]|nr:MAG: hypothetical protein M1831_000827 [Alyxoria varia]
MDSMQSLEWSSQFEIEPTSTSSLSGDKISLPQSALEQLLAAAPTVSTLNSGPQSRTAEFDPYNPYSFAAERHARAQSQFDRQKQLPNPLTFRLVNAKNGRVVYAGIREFSAEEGQVRLSEFLRRSLDVRKPEGPAESGRVSNGIDRAEEDKMDGLAEYVTVHARQLSKGTYVKLRPLEAGYNPDDWKSLLEEHLRKNFTTLSKGEVLTVPAGRDNFRFLIDEFKPDEEAVCVVDTDLEVDIEALNEDQARETLRKIAEKAHRAPGTDQGSSVGGQLDLFKPLRSQQVLEGEYVDYQIQSWDRSQALNIELEVENDQETVSLLASPFSTRQRSKPREDEHVFADFNPRPAKRIRLSPTNIELKNAEELWISVHAAQVGETASSVPVLFSIKASAVDPSAPDTAPDRADSIDEPTPGPDEKLCPNCKQLIPAQSLFLHENFCHRNNILCPKGCNRIFQKRSPTYATHWHCPEPACTSSPHTSSGDTPSSQANHTRIFHTPQHCPSCTYPSPFPSLLSLSHHRTTTCPSKPILCQFCHLLVPQEGSGDDPTAPPDPELLLTDLTAHEHADGSRTTECHICGRITRLRDMSTHLRHHSLERLSRPAPRVCRNVNCGRTLDGTGRDGDTRKDSKRGQGAANELGVCGTCYGPLYVSLYDPEGKALRRRVERRYLGQLVGGCGKSWCGNEYCKTGRVNVASGRGGENGISGADVKTATLTTKDAIPLVKPFIDSLFHHNVPLHFCVDELSQKRRGLAELLASERDATAKSYSFEWCVGALEAENGDLNKAKEWLGNFAPTDGEVRDGR